MGLAAMWKGSFRKAAQHKSFGAVIGPRSCDERPVTYEVVALLESQGGPSGFDGKFVLVQSFGKILLDHFGPFSGLSLPSRFCNCWPRLSGRQRRELEHGGNTYNIQDSCVMNILC